MCVPVIAGANCHCHTKVGLTKLLEVKVNGNVRPNESVITSVRFVSEMGEYSVKVIKGELPGVNNRS